MSQSKFEDALLDHARTDRPSPARRRAAKAAFLASAAVATGAATTSTAAAATVKGAAASSLSSTTLLKLAIAIAVGSGGVAGVVAVTSQTTTPLPREPAPIVGVAPSSTAPSLPASVAPSITIEEEAAPAPVVAPPTKPRPPAEDGLVTEARLLEAARACLARSDFACTEARLAEHAKRFGARGALAEEASILAIESAKKSGDREALRLRANAFLTEHPTSSYVPRVRAALRSIEENTR